LIGQFSTVNRSHFLLYGTKTVEYNRFTVVETGIFEPDQYGVHYISEFVAGHLTVEELDIDKLVDSSEDRLTVEQMLALRRRAE
jgi:hypothetical protein